MVSVLYGSHCTIQHVQVLVVLIYSWCELFTDEDQAVMEYYLDMKMYWKRGERFECVGCTGQRFMHVVN